MYGLGVGLFLGGEGGVEMEGCYTEDDTCDIATIRH